MWRSVLLGLLMVLFSAAASMAQIDRNLESRSRAESNARRRPAQRQTQPRKQAAVPVKLSPAQAALTRAIAEACRDAARDATQYEAQRKRLAAAAAKSRLRARNAEPAAEQPSTAPAAPPAEQPEPVAEAPEAAEPTPAESAPAAPPEPEPVAEPAPQPEAAPQTEPTPQPEAPPQTEQAPKSKLAARHEFGHKQEPVAPPAATPDTKDQAFETPAESQPAPPAEQPAAETPTARAPADEAADTQQPSAPAETVEKLAEQAPAEVEPQPEPQPLIPRDAKARAEADAKAAEEGDGTAQDSAGTDEQQPASSSLSALSKARRAPVRVTDETAVDDKGVKHEAEPPQPAEEELKPAADAADNADAVLPAADKSDTSAAQTEDTATSAAEGNQEEASPALPNADDKPAETEQAPEPNRRPNLSRWGRRAREKQQEDALTASADSLLNKPTDSEASNEKPAEPENTDETTDQTPADADAAHQAEAATGDEALAADAATLERDGEPAKAELAARPEGSSAWPKDDRALPEDKTDTRKPELEQQTGELDAGTTLDQLAAAGGRAEPARTVAAVLPAPALERNLVLSPEVAGGRPTSAGMAAPVDLVLPGMTSSVPSVELPRDLVTLSRGNPKRKLVALTFDDGPHPLYTSQLLAVLHYYDVPATFFFVGLQAQKYPQWVKMAHQAGHEIGSHTYDHFRLPKLPPSEQAYQIDEYQRLIEGLTGTTPRFLRPPGGQVDDGLKKLAAKHGMVIALWDVALNDTAQDKTSARMLKSTVKSVRPGSVILAHDGIQATVEMLPLLITTLRKEGYQFVTMSELAADMQ